MNPLLTWLDAETTGLYASDEFLLEVACVVTDSDLNVLDDQGYSTAVYYPAPVSQLLREKAIPIVKTMHDNTGLWDRLPNGKLLSTVDQELKSYISQFAPEPRTSWLGGNSITLDRDFMRHFLPGVYNHLHYRSVDVTSIAGPADWWYGESFPKQKKHDAFSDILESIEELRYLRRTIFK